MNQIKPYTKNSPYYDAMYDAIQRMAGEGKYTFVQAELASMLNRNITQSMRRALALLEAQGVVQSFRFLTERGGLSVGYQITQEQMKMPFAAEMPF